MFKQLINLTVVIFLGLSINSPQLANAKTNTFIDNGNGSVTDTATGLIWQQQANTNGATHANAIVFCQGLNLAGSSDWRLPNIKELTSLIDYGLHSPAIDTAIFPNTFSRVYWSGSNRTSSLAWAVGFSSGTVNEADKSSIFNSVRCVL